MIELVCFIQSFCFFLYPTCQNRPGGGIGQVERCFALRVPYVRVGAMLEESFKGKKVIIYKHIPFDIFFCIIISCY